MKIFFNPQKIMQILRDRGISVKEFAEGARISPRTVKAACLGKAVQFKSASRLAAALNVPIDELQIA